MKADELLQKVDTFTQKNIIFDLTGVLFKFDKMFFISEVGRGSLLLYAIRHLKNPFDFVGLTLDFLDKISPATHNKYYKGKILPQLAADWAIGAKTNQEILTEIRAALEKFDRQGYFKSSIEKHIISTAAQSLFTPEKLAHNSLIPIENGIKLLQAFAQKKDALGNPYHHIYLLSNIDNESFPMLVKKHADIFDRFQGLVVSGAIGSMKPDQKIYEHLLQKYQLNPKECVFFDDQEENIEAAEKEHGIKSIQFVE